MTTIKIELPNGVIVELTQGEAEALYWELDALLGNFFKNPIQPPVPAIPLPIYDPYPSPLPYELPIITCLDNTSDFPCRRDTWS